MEKNNSQLSNSKYLIKILAVLFCISFLFLGFGQTVNADISCGTTISSPGTYTLEADKLCDGTWVTINASNVTINNGGSYSVTYGNTLVQNGIVFSQYALHSDVTVNGIILNQGANGGHAIYKNSGRSAGITLSNNTINLNGAPANILTTGGYALSSEVPSAIYFRDLSFTGIYEHVVNVFGNTILVNPTTINQAYGTLIAVSGDDWVSGSIYNNAVTLGPNTGVGRPTAINGVAGNSSNKFRIYNNTLTMQGQLNSGIRFIVGQLNNLIYNNTILVTSDADNTKSISMDNTDNNEVYSNTITINSTDISSNSYGIRVRGDSENNLIHHNTIDTRGQTGVYGAYAISVGAVEASYPAPSDNYIYGNTLHSNTAPYDFYEGSINTQIYNNTATNSNNGSIVIFHPAGPVTDALFSNETWSTGGSTYVSIPNNSPGSLTGVVFCNSGIATENVNDPYTIGGWIITAGPCTIPTTYTITASTGANGSISPNGATIANSGSVQIFTITPSSGYHVLDVLVDDISVGVVSSHEFSNIITGHTISATFEIDPSSAKAITAFDFNALNPAVTGTVNEGAKTIALTVPYGTAVTALVPTITITGASVSPASGASTDFTTPQTYTVTADDALTQDYTVTVTVSANIETPSPTVTVGGGNAMMFAVLQARAKEQNHQLQSQTQNQSYSQEQKQILIAELKLKLIDLIKQLIVLLQEQMRNNN